MTGEPANTGLALRDAEARDLDATLVLNEAVVPAVNSLDPDRMRWFFRTADYCRVVNRGGELLGFMIGFFEGSDYASDNYRWFSARYERFAYVDRVAVSDSARRLGVASALYADFVTTIGESRALMTCEVNLRPPNPGSLAFHERLGFRQVATQTLDGGSKEVALMVRNLTEAP